MKKMLVTTVAAAAMFVGASAAYAQDSTMYMTGAGESRMIMDGSSPNGARVMTTTDGMAPADCPAGSYYDGPKETVVACGDGGMTYGMMAPPAGAMMSDGKTYPEGAMMLESREGNNAAQ